MKKIPSPVNKAALLALLFVWLTLFQNIYLIAAPSEQHADAHTSTQEPLPAADLPKPPKDSEGPIFPMEELIPQPNKQTDRFLTELLNMLAMLGLIVALMLIVAWFLKRLVNTKIAQANSESAIKIIERRTLSPKTMLYLIELQEKTILIAESQQGVARLAELSTSESNPNGSSFKNILEKKE